MTADEAVAWLGRSLTREYRRECLAFWRTHLGEEFASKVEATFTEKWAARKRTP